MEHAAAQPPPPRVPPPPHPVLHQPPPPLPGTQLWAGAAAVEPPVLLSRPAVTAALSAGLLFGLTALFLYAFILILPLLLAIPTVLVAIALAGNATVNGIAPGQSASRSLRGIGYGVVIGLIVLLNVGLPAISRYGGPSVIRAMGGSLVVTCALCAVLRYAEISLVKKPGFDGSQRPS